MAKQSRKRLARVGDRVRSHVAAREIVADVVEDQGHIGLDGHHVVHVSFVGEDGEIQRMDWPNDERTLLPRDPATA